jgi:beta-lactam-binding protein with PASTA domain
MQPALNMLGAQPEAFPAPPYLSTGSKRVTYRDGRIELDNGRCRDVSLLVYFTGHGPAKTANCKLNEVDVPNVVGWHLDAARVRLAAQPLTPQVIYEPATAGQRVDVVVRQFPKAGTLSSFGRVTIVLARPLHGTVPKIVGLQWRKANAKLQRLKLKVTMHSAKGKIGRVIAQVPPAGVAAAPGMKVAVTVGTGG